MSNNIEYPPDNPRNGKAMAGIILLVVGGILLLQQFSILFIPDRLELWPLWLVGWGLFIGARSNFHKPVSFILILLGVVFLIDQNIPRVGGFIWPLGIICFGLWMILRRRTSFDKDYWTKRNSHKWDWNANMGPNPPDASADPNASATPPPGSTGYPPTGDEYLDAVSVFGGVKKKILSKDFKGGEIVNVFGGAEIDFTQAEINGRVIIDITQIFGGTKIIVPSHWQVVSDLAAVFAGVDDKRMRTTAPLNTEKILVLKGVSIFAGVDIRSF